MRKKYNIGIIGTGKIAAKMAQAIHFIDDAIPYAVASRTQERADHFAQQHHFMKAYGDYESLLADEEVSLVYIATPHNLHFENTMLALNNDKHALCEKPLAVNYQEVRQMFAKANEKQLFLMEAMWTSFMPHMAKAQELVKNGAIGKIKFLKADFGMFPNFDPESRLFNKNLIGGALMDIGIYPVFLALSFLGKPKEILASAGLGVTGVDINCNISFHYENESMAVLSASMQSRSGINAAIEGEKGSIIFDSPWHMPSNFKLVHADGKVERFEFEEPGNGYQYELAAAIESLNNNNIQNKQMSWNTSLDLIQLLDEIRKQFPLVYPKHDLSL